MLKGIIKNGIRAEVCDVPGDEIQSYLAEGYTVVDTALGMTMEPEYIGVFTGRPSRMYYNKPLAQNLKGIAPGFYNCIGKRCAPIFKRA
jgi:hypothetical protein